MGDGNMPSNGSQVIGAKVHWDSPRKMTDVPFAIIYVCSVLLFLSLGFSMVGSNHSKYVTTGSIQDGTFTMDLTEYYKPDAAQCCADLLTGDHSDYSLGEGGLCQYVNEGRRSLAEGTTAFPSDGYMFDAFTLSPEIPATLISGVLAMAVFWVVLLKAFAKPIVFATEVLKVVAMIYVGVKMDEKGGNPTIFYIGAVIQIAYVVYFRKNLEFAAKMISHACLALQENKTMFLGLIFVKMFYVLQAVLFITFISASSGVKEVMPSYTATYDAETSTTSLGATCVLRSPAWVSSGLQIISMCWLFSVMFYTQVRLAVIAFVVGSWHFHPDNKPGVFAAIKIACTTSLGTISLSGLIQTIVDEIKRQTDVKWYQWCNCSMWPIYLCLTLIGYCLATCIKMLTKFTLIIHCFTGESFFGSAKMCFGLMSRHFVNGMVTEATSVSVLKLGSFVFSTAFAFSAWFWVDETYGWNTFEMVGTWKKIQFFLWIFFLLFNVKHPVLGVFFIVFIDQWFEKSDIGGQEYWVAPFCAAFVGCIASLFFDYMAGIILDTVDVMFVCYAVDKDNGVDMTNQGFALLVMEMPGDASKQMAPQTSFVSQNSGGGNMLNFAVSNFDHLMRIGRQLFRSSFYIFGCKNF